MAKDEEMARVGALYDGYAGLVGLSDDLKLRTGEHIGRFDLGVARMGHVENVVHAAHEWGRGLQDFVRIHA